MADAAVTYTRLSLISKSWPHAPGQIKVLHNSGTQKSDVNIKSYNCLHKITTAGPAQVEEGRLSAAAMRCRPANTTRSVILLCDLP